MARPIDELIVEIKADTRDLQKQLNQINGKLKATGAAGGAAFGALGGATAGLKGSMGKLAGAAGIGAVLLAIGKLGTFSARAGMEFEDLKDSLDTVFGSIEAGDKQFKRILNFAQTTPFQIDTVTKAFISLGSVGIEPTARMMQVFADTASVAVDQRGAFEALIRVVQRAEAGALGLQELNMLADRGIDVFKGLKDELGLSRLELTDFGQTAGGAKIIVESLVNVLERQFGGAMVNKMDNLSVAISNMEIAFKSLGNEIFEAGVADFFKFFVDKAATAANAVAVSLAAIRGEGLGITLEAPTLTGGMSFDQMQTTRANSAKNNINAIDNELAKYRITQDGVNDIQEKFSLALAKTGSDVVTFSGKFQLAKNLLAEFGVTESEAQQIVANLIEERKNQVEALKQATQSQTQLNDAQKEEMLTAGKLVRAFGLLEKHLEDVRGDTDLLNFAQTNLGKIFQDNKQRLSELGITSEEQLLPVLDALREKSEGLGNTFAEIFEPAIQQISMSMTSDFVNALMEGEDALDSFDKFAKSMVAQIITTFLQLAVVNQILNNIFGLNLPTKTLGEIFGRAGGGKIQKGTPTIVGERGAEIIVPDSGGTIMNNMNSKNAMGGTPIIVNQSVNFATGVVPTVRAEISKMMPQIAQVTKGAVAEASVRGGSYRRLLQGG